MLENFESMGMRGHGFSFDLIFFALYSVFVL